MSEPSYTVRVRRAKRENLLAKADKTHLVLEIWRQDGLILTPEQMAFVEAHPLSNPSSILRTEARERSNGCRMRKHRRFLENQG